MTTGRPPGSSSTRANFLKDERVRDGLFAALLAVLAALTIRFLAASPFDYLHYSVLTELTGIEFGDWPDIFYAGAGGDGEVFAVLAVDPFGSGPSQLILSVVYRFGRVGMSLLAFGLSFGQEGLVLPALFTIGLSAVATVGFLSGYWRERFGLRSWALVLNPALYIGFIGDTAEPLGIVLLIFALVGTGYWAAAALGVTRPTFGVALFGRWKQLAALVAAAIVVNIVALLIFDGSLLDSPPRSFAFPPMGYVNEPSIVGFLVLFAGAFTLVRGMLRRDLAWLASGLLVVALGEAITVNPVNAVRAAGMLPVLWAVSQTSTSASPVVEAS